MKLSSDGEVSYLTLAVVEAELAHFPCFRLLIEDSDRGFTASSTAWVAADDVQTFAAQLRQCQRIGRGRALLAAMSPSELDLRVEPSDALGHFRMIYRVAHQWLNNGGWQETVLTGGFELDTYRLEQMVETAELLAL